MDCKLTELPEHLEERLLDYLQTAYLTKDQNFNKARENLIKNKISGPMLRPPQFEIQDRYQLSGITYEKYFKNRSVFNEVSKSEYIYKFLNSVEKNILYKHQINSIETALFSNEHINVTHWDRIRKNTLFFIANNC